MTGAPTDGVNVLLLVISTPATLLFVILYALTQPFYRSWWGWALMVSQASLSALLLVNLLYRIFGWEILAREGWLRVVVYAAITVGAVTMLGAFVNTFTQWRRRIRS